MAEADGDVRRWFGGGACRIVNRGEINRSPTAEPPEDGSMDPVTTLVIAIAFLVTVDVAALNLGGERRRPARRRLGR
jgi:hypothetical protein